MKNHSPPYPYPDKQSVEATSIISVADYLSKISEGERNLEVGQTWFYRGHKLASYELTPSLFRSTHQEEEIRGWDQIENDILREFRQNVGQHLPELTGTKGDTKALAQHHGVPTSLLDWTFNPLVALFFAVESLEPGSGEEDGHVWALSGSHMRGGHQPDLRIIQISRGFSCFTPSIINARMAAQRGCFTEIEDYLPPEEKPNSVTGLPNGDFKLFKISHEKRSEFQCELHKLGIDYQSLFPGIDGLGRHLKWVHTIKNKFVS